MDMYPTYKSALGYTIGNDGIDSYGVDHRNFTTRDETRYQNARYLREQEIIKMLNEQGITSNYPQYGTNFWGDAGNNYGFGTTNIENNIANHPYMNTTPIPWNNLNNKSVDYSLNQTPIIGNNTDLTTEQKYDNYLTEEQRIQALKNGDNLRLHIDENPNWNGQWGKHCWNWVGKYYVDKYNDQIEKYAMQNNIDPDKLRAVMFAENACGNYVGANYLMDVLGWSGSQMPMNIQGKTWKDFQGKHYNTDVPEQNIELSALLLKQIENSLDNPTMDRITTVWNRTGANQISPFGGHGQIAYDTKPWLGEKQWGQKLLEFFFGNKKK